MVVQVPPSGTHLHSVGDHTVPLAQATFCTQAPASGGGGSHASWMHAPPIGAQMPQLALQQNWPALHVFDPHFSVPVTPPVPGFRPPAPCMLPPVPCDMPPVFCLAPPVPCGRPPDARRAPPALC